MTIQAVIFDLGGVIVRTSDFTPREHLAAQFGVTRRELEALVFSEASGLRAQRGEIPVEEHWENVRRALNLPAEAMAGFQQAFWGADRVDMELVEYIRSLHRTYRTALLSNMFSDLRGLITERWQIADAFDEILISAEVDLTKPDPRIFQILVDRLGVAPAEAVFIDDFIENIRGARAAGLQAVHFRSPEQLYADLEQLLSEHPG